MRRRRGWRKETGLTGGPHRSATEGEGGGAGPRGEAGQAGRRGGGKLGRGLRAIGPGKRGEERPGWAEKRERGKRGFGFWF